MSQNGQSHFENLVAFAATIFKMFLIIEGLRYEKVQDESRWRIVK